MPDAIQKDASAQTPTEPIMEPAFPSGPNPEHQGQSKHSESVDEMSDRYEAEREAELQRQIAVDPDLAAVQSRAEAHQTAVSAQMADEASESEAASAAAEADGAASVEPMHPSDKAEDSPAPPAPSEPAAEAQPIDRKHIVEQDGVEYMRLNVEGQIQLVPLDRAVAELQKGVAGDARLARASQMNTELARRANALKQREESLESRMTSIQPPQGAVGLDLNGLGEDSKGFVSTMFEGSEDEAAQKLAGLVERAVATRGITQPGVDQNQVAAIVRQVVDRDKEVQDARSILAKFGRDFPDLAREENLFNQADKFCDTVEAEHPDWNRDQVMQEAGERTRRWIKTLAGVDSTSTQQEDSTPQPSLSSERHKNKTGLVPMPAPKTGVQPPVSAEVPQTREDYLAEVRLSRNQPS